MDKACGFCGIGEFRSDGRRYYCSHCDMSVWMNGLMFRGVPFISEDRARKLLAGRKAVFTCVSRSSGRPYDVEVKLSAATGKLEVELAPRRRKKA
ncbi:MAG: hypothetical protein K0R57_1668 [Paenibacillaceae bacterium]|nr:hypothetical protein [Paenibacillaceae bacterium]